MEELRNRQSSLPLILVLLVGAVLTLFSLGDHPFYGRSDVRYAEVSREMLEHGDGLVPLKRGKVHLTKPPLVYWMEAGAMKLLGTNELAARLPSALAGCGTLAILAALAWKRHGRDTAIFATAMLAVMPLHVIVSRLPLTDGILGCFWFATLACGLLAVQEPNRRRWPMLLWTAVALALLAKGPQGLIPVGVLLMWLALAGRWREIRSLRLGSGLPASVIPLCAWATTIVLQHPEAYRIWIDNLAGRNIETAAHPEPWWYYLPFALGGLFPAVLTLRTPGVTISFRDVVARLRGGDDHALWLLAILLPLVIFSVRTGKLITYILPLCAPAAMLGGAALRRWLNGEYENVQPRWAPRPWTVLLLVMAGGVGVVIAGQIIAPSVATRYAARTQGDGREIMSLLPNTWILGVLILVAAAAAVGQWWILRRGQNRPLCRWAMTCAWCSIAAIGLGMAEAEDRVLSLTRIREIAGEAQRIATQQQTPILLFRTRGLSLDFYLQTDVRAVTAQELREAMATPQALCVIADKRALDALVKRDANLLHSFEQTPVLNPVPADKPLCIVWRSAEKAEMHALR